MCGRFTLFSDRKAINQLYGIDSDLQLKPRYRITPLTNCPIVRLSHDKRELALCHWGLIPHWVKDTKLQPINAKAETVKAKPFFRNAFKKQHCLIPVNGYYEWKGTKGKKQPYYIHPVNDELFSFAYYRKIRSVFVNLTEPFTFYTLH